MLQLINFFTDLENTFLVEGGYVASSDKATIADLSLVFLLSLVRIYNDFSKYEKVKKYIERVYKNYPDVKTDAEEAEKY